MGNIKKYSIIMSIIIVVIFAGIWYMLLSDKSKLPSHGKAPDFELTDIDDNTVRFQDMNGKVRLVYFFFASCTDVCPITTQQMTQIQNKLKEKSLYGKDIQLISISVDPKRDTKEVLRQYGDSFGVDWDGWSFLRGETEEQIEQISKGYNAGLYNINGEFVHSDRLYLVDRSGVIRKMDLEHDADELVKDIQSLLKES